MNKNLYLSYILFSVFLFVSCTQPASHGMKKKVLKIAFPSDPTVLDPRKGSDPIASTTHFALFEGLTRINEHSTKAYGAAESIDISDDQLTYTFHLRESFWSNGSPVTAFDFEYAWKSAMTPSFPCPNAHLFYPIKNAEKVKSGNLNIEDLGVRVIDEKTLEVTLEAPTPYFLELTSFCVFFPVPHEIVSKNPSWADDVNPDLVTNGPYKLASWRHNNELIFEKNSLFWEADAIELDNIHVSVISDEVTAFSMYQKNQLDFFGGILNSIPPDWVPDLKKKDLLKTLPLGATIITTFNVNSPIFKNKNMRKAFSYAINRKSLTDNITQVDEIPALGFIAPVLKENESRVFFPDGDNQDTIDQAQKYLNLGLTELGLSKSDLSKELTYYYVNNTVYKRVAQELQQQWKEHLGVDIPIEEYELKILLDKLNRRAYHFAQCYWVVQYNDQMNVFDRFRLSSNPKNYPGWENNEYQSLLELSSLQTNRKERLATLEQAEKVLINDMPLTALYHWNNLFLIKNHIKGLYISPIGSIHFNNTRIETKVTQNEN